MNKTETKSSGLVTQPEPARINFVKEILAGLTVSFVAISLGAAFGVMSGRGALAGILSAGILFYALRAVRPIHDLVQDTETEGFMDED